jgi:hypothetical protein
MRDGLRDAENSQNRLEKRAENPAETGAKGGPEKSGRPVRVETKASAIILATDILLKRFNDRHCA